MSGKKSKFKDVFCGILTAIGLWIFGHLLSGRLLFVEDIELYPTGPAVFIFPFSLAAVCILIAKYAVKNKKYIYFIASIVSIISPFAFWLAARLMNIVMSWNIPEISDIAIIIQIIFLLPSIAPLSIFSQMNNNLDSFSDTVRWCLMAANLIPIVVGLVISITIVVKNRKSNPTDLPVSDN